jgi:hypothetical protein
MSPTTRVETPFTLSVESTSVATSAASRYYNFLLFAIAERGTKGVSPHANTS